MSAIFISVLNPPINQDPLLPHSAFPQVNGAGFLILRFPKSYSTRWLRFRKGCFRGVSEVWEGGTALRSGQAEDLSSLRELSVNYPA